MAVIPVLIFTVGGYNYNVSYDDAGNYCFCETDAPEPISQATPVELGAAYGEVLYDHCVGLDLWEVKANKFWPFAQPVFSVNAVACGFVPIPCTLAISSITKTDESQQYAQDGSIIVNTTGGLNPKMYSLDNAIFQASNTFNLLPPGSYTVYVKDANNCTDTLAFVIAEGAPAPVVPYPWKDNVCHWFGLKVNGVTTQIREPVKWDSITLLGKRDPAWHGFNYQFSDGSIDMEFDCPAGKEIIDAEYAANGSDGEIILLYGYLKGATVFNLFEGKLNLNTLKFYPGKVACAVERKDNNNIFQSRYDTKVSIDATEDLDGNVIVPPMAHSFTLHPKSIERNYRNEITVPQEVFSGIFPQNGYVQLDTSMPAVSEIEDYYGYPGQVSDLSPVDFDKYNWLIKYRGTASLRVKFNIDLALSNINPLFVSTYEVKHYVRVNGTETQIGSTVTGALGAGEVDELSMVVDNTLPLDLNPLDKIYIYTHILFNSSLLHAAAVRTNELLITLVSEEQTTATDSKAWWVEDTIKHVVSAISGSMVRSNFFSRLTAGPAARFVINNGFQVRQYEPALRPLKISAKDLLESLRAIFCLGLGMQEVSGQQVIRIERVPHFYQDKEILLIGEIWDYRKEVAKDICYNEIEIGYETFQDDGYNTLDEFNTKREMTTPIRTNKAKFFQKSKLIASGYSIETSRRQQFAATATNSFQNDDSPFIFALSSAGQPEKDEAFTTVAGIISPETAYNLRISPLRMLINWFVWLQGCFYFKDATDELKTTFIQQNTDLVTQFLPGEPNPIGDVDLLEWQEKQNVPLALMAAEAPLFMPEWIYFKARLQPDAVEMVMRALKGQYGAAVDHGYISFIDNEGVSQSGWPYEISYNFYTEQVDFKLLRKWQ